MKKEIYICDRCGKEMQHTVRETRYISGFTKLKKTAEIKTMIAERRGYIQDKYLTLPEVNEIEVVENYNFKNKEYILCPDCRKLFERFMKNEY